MPWEMSFRGPCAFRRRQSAPSTLRPRILPTPTQRPRKPGYSLERVPTGMQAQAQATGTGHSGQRMALAIGYSAFRSMVRPQFTQPPASPPRPANPQLGPRPALRCWSQLSS